MDINEVFNLIYYFFIAPLPRNNYSAIFLKF